MTPQQRYHQAVKKARILQKRSLKDFMSGMKDVLPCAGDIERDCLIREIERAYEAGRSEGRVP